MQQYSRIAAVVAVAAVIVLVANLATRNSATQPADAAPDEMVQSEGSNNSTEVRLQIGEITPPSEGSNNSVEVNLQIEE